ncbi:transporter, putative [Ricinus communis]|uniref:Transporter, putative n=2 Tax=Ricinus communis TaxID=3988 RepID=B9SX19_RICCO|nr:transporter, putative [Ricinus communis]
MAWIMIGGTASARKLGTDAVQTWDFRESLHSTFIMLVSWKDRSAEEFEEYLTIKLNLERAYNRACAIYSNWWPMLSALMYVLVPMPCLFFGGGSTQFLISRDGGGWIGAAKFLTGASAVGSIAIPVILRHAHMIETGAMLIEFTSFFIFVCTVLCFHRASLEDDW